MCSYVARFEPTTLRSKGFDSTNAPSRPTLFSTGCQSHSASSTSSLYLFFNHYMELFPSICEIAALELIPLRQGYDCDHLRSTCAEDEDAFRQLCFLGRWSSMLEQSPACYSFV